jgi:hypothetical protein
MTRLQYLVIPVLTCLILMFSGIFQSHPSPLLSLSREKESQQLPPPAFQVEPAAAPELAGVDPLLILDQAIHCYQPANVQWLTMKLWQRGEFQKMTYQIEGEYWEAPGYRMRLMLRTDQGTSPVRMEMLSDGKAFYEVIHFPGSDPVEKWFSFSPSGRPGVPVSEQMQKEIIRDKGYPGLTYLLHTVRQNLRDLRLRGVTCNGHPMLEIRGTWPNCAPAEANKAARLPLKVIVRECCLYLDRESFWPYRIEWWGIQEGDTAPRLILQTEYREPVINQPLSTEDADKTFSVPPTKKKFPHRGF